MCSCTVLLALRDGACVVVLPITDVIVAPSVCNKIAWVQTNRLIRAKSPSHSMMQSIKSGL